MELITTANSSTFPGRIPNFQTLAYICTSGRAKVSDGVTDAAFRSSRCKSNGCLRALTRSEARSLTSACKYSHSNLANQGVSEFKLEFPFLSFPFVRKPSPPALSCQPQVAMEIGLPRTVERWMDWLAPAFAHWVSTFKPSSSRSIQRKRR